VNLRTLSSKWGENYVHRLFGGWRWESRAISVDVLRWIQLLLLYTSLPQILLGAVIASLGTSISSTICQMYRCQGAMMINNFSMTIKTLILLIPVRMKNMSLTNHPRWNQMSRNWKTALQKLHLPAVSMFESSPAGYTMIFFFSISNPAQIQSWKLLQRGIYVSQG